MFETIVVGVDDDPSGRDALSLAARLTSIFESRLIAVLARPHHSFVSRAVRDEPHRTLASELEKAAVEAEQVVASDTSPRRALYSAAERQDADLLVVGANRHGPIGRLLAGDVTAATLHGAPCAVAVAPRGLSETSPRLRTVGIGFDGSPESYAAVDLGRDVARTAGAGLRLLWIVPAAVSVDPWATRAVERNADDRAARKHAEAVVAKTVRELGDDAIGDAAPGLAHKELAQLTHEVDLLIVGSRGGGRLRRQLHGSTSTRLVREAACPVLVLPRDARRHAAAAAGTTAARKAA